MVCRDHRVLCEEGGLLSRREVSSGGGCDIILFRVPQSPELWPCMDVGAGWDTG
jgi:hypothetical protein